MTKIAKPPTTRTTTPRSSVAPGKRQSSPIGSSSTRNLGRTTGSASATAHFKGPDSAKFSKDAQAGGAGASAIGGLLNGLQDWGGAASATSAGESKALSLDQGQLLRKGASGDKVTQLQELLNSKGAKLEVDGKFGGKTLEALKKFQGQNELGQDGVLGPKTLEKLNAQGAGGESAAKAGETAKVGEAAKSGETAKAGEVAKTGEAGNPGEPSKGGRFSDTRASLDNLAGPLKKYADVFQKAGEKHGVDPRFLAAIAMHETGGGTSKAFRNKNNAMGISGKKGPLHISSVEESINRMAKGLANPNGYYKGKTTIGQIGKVYAPKGAQNDPGGLNGYWPKGVAKFYKQFGGDPTQQVIFR